MITFLVVFLGIFSIGLYIGKKKDDYIDWGLGGFLLGITVALFACMFIGFSAPVHQETQTVKLYSLGDSQGLYGSFFLGIGTVGNWDYYSFRTIDSEGMVQKSRYAIDYSHNIYYENPTAEPGHEQMLLRVLRYDNPHYWLWGFGRGDANKVYRVEFQVPPGSIKRGFVLD